MMEKLLYMENENLRIKIKNLKRTIFVLCIILVILLFSITPIEDDGYIVDNEENIFFDRIILNNPELQTYEMMDHTGCKDLEHIDICKIIAFEDHQAYVIMSFDFKEFDMSKEEVLETIKNAKSLI